MKIVSQYGIDGESASAIAASVETAIREHRLSAGAPLPTVRALADALRVSPTTVSAAYRLLRTRGLVHAKGRNGTRVSHRPPLPVRPAAVVPAHLRDLANGNPDPALLPPLGDVLARLEPSLRLYGERTNRQDLLKLAARRFADDGVPRGPIAVVGGALDGIERVLQARVRPGDRIAVEDPGYTGVLDLVAALGLVPEPYAVDDAGPVGDDLARALAAGSKAVIVTPRAQNPIGAALDAKRARELRALLARHDDVLVVEDDHAGPVAGVPAVSLCQKRGAWAVVRSVSKSLGPDLRVALLTGDDATIARVEGRQSVGTGWVSHLLQEMVVALWSDRSTEMLLRRAAETYTERRDALVHALAAHGIEAHGRSGMNVWVPVAEEAAAVTALAEAGWAVRAGERYRLRARPAIRITIATLKPAEAEQLAADIARIVAPQRRTASA
jgi:DNA-binding transcriptional MocR family regulator